jgi:hypothetical protein
MKAYMIMDWNNPISVRYAQYSTKSWEKVKDLVSIEPFQCVTPETLDTSYFPWMELPECRKTKTECSILATYYQLYLLGTFEKFIIMEHDAYLYPHREKIFRQVFKYIDLDIWNVGMAVECHSYSSSVSEQLARLLESNKFMLGPMGLVHQTNYKGEILFVESGHNTGKGYIGLGKNIDRIASGFSDKRFDAPVTQCYNNNWGFTNVNPYTPESHPNMHFFLDKW